MSKGLKKKSHWTSRVHEIVIVRNPEGQLGFELKGGAENGQFPYLGEVKPGKVAYEGGSKLVPEELLLEVNETPVAGLTIRDVLAVIKHCKDPIRGKVIHLIPGENDRLILGRGELGRSGRERQKETWERTVYFRLSSVSLIYF
uniref:PDZ domain-containing protein n=1 Tax=Buteo japonicus TaxID=224669 RepID=A0A8C0BYP5_9AVES